MILGLEGHYYRSSTLKIIEFPNETRSYSRVYDAWYGC